MATTGKNKTTKSVETKELPAYIKWEDKTNAQRQESINTYYKMILAKAIGEKKTFWDKDMNKQEIDNSMPYNARTGQVYSGLSSLVLRAVKELNGYEDSNFLTMKEANILGGKLKKELDENGKEKLTRDGKSQYVKGMKVAYLKKYDFVDKLDSNGKPIMKEVTRKDGTKFLDNVKEIKYLKEPMLETLTYYHISQFDGLDKSKLVGRNLSSLEKFRQEQKDKPFDIKEKVDNLNLGSKTNLDLNNFLNSQLKGLDYQKINHAPKIEQSQTKAKELNQGR